MTPNENPQLDEDELVIHEIVELERKYFFEKRNVKTERQRKLREIIERHIKFDESEANDY
jgi:hypothetical protein